MTINVVFRGPCLFVKKHDSIDEVLIPDGRRRISNGGVIDRHPDNTPARKHFAGILVLKASGGIAMRMSLHGKRVAVRDPHDPAACTTHASFDDVVPVSALSNGGDATKHLRLLAPGPDYWTRVATAVELEGGTIGSSELSALTFHFPKDHNPNPPAARRVPLLATWTPTGDEAVILISDASGGDPLQISLTEGQVAWIYNFDTQEPVPKEMGPRLPPCKKAGPLEDRDFKWLYQLLDPPGGDWAKWLNGSLLPAPLSTCPGPNGVAPAGAPVSPAAAAVGAAAANPSPDVASCFFGSWP